MEKTLTFRLDGDCLTVPLVREERTGVLLAEYPDFEEAPRYTPGGLPWRSVISTGCPHAAGEYDDCGSCPHLMKQSRGDIIGVCCHLSMRRNNQ